MKMRNTIWLVAVVMALLMSASLASAAAVALPHTSEGSNLTAAVSEQADVSVDTTVAFAVGDVTSATDADAASSVGATVIVLTVGNALKIELAPNATAFTPPSGSGTWASSAVSWTATSWSNGTKNDASLSAEAAAYTEVARSSANAASCESTGLMFHLAANVAASPAIEAGDHTLTATWKFSSFDPS